MTVAPDKIETLLTIRPVCTNTQPRNPDFELLRRLLGEELRISFSDSTDSVVDRALAIVVDSQVQGVFCPVGLQKVPLLVGVLQYVVYRPQVSALPAIWREPLMRGVERTAQVVAASPFHGLPTWEAAPILRFIWEYFHSAFTATDPGVPRGLLQALSNLLDIVRAGYAREQAFDLRKNVYDLTVVMRKYMRLATGEAVGALPAYPTGIELMHLYQDLIAQSPPPDAQGTGRSRQSYESDIWRLVKDQPGQRWIERAYGGRRPSEGVKPGRSLFASRVDCDELFVPAVTEAADGEEEVEIAAFGEKTAARPPKLRTAQKPSGPRAPYRGDWPQTLYRNPTRHTPGVLALVEVALVLRGLLELARREGDLRVANAQCVLWGGILYGWTRQLWRARFCVQAPDTFTHPGLVFLERGAFASLKPQIPLGWPAEIVPEAGRNRKAYLAARQELARDFEPVEPCYLIALHPVLVEPLNVLAKHCSADRPIITDEEYRVALDDLLQCLNSFCQAEKPVPMTAGRLSLTFRGYCDGYGLDGPAAYVVSGRPMKHQEMSINYTRISVTEACRMHWAFADRLVGDVREQYDRLGQLFRLA
jgi:hypothetical protein